MTAKPKPPIISTGIALPLGGWRFEVSGWCMPSLNGSDGLMRMHWSKRKDPKDVMDTLVAQAKPPMFTVQVRMSYTRFSPRVLDWDNLASTTKVLNDALVRAGVIVDDSPRWIPEAPKLNQIKGPLGFILDIFPVDKDD